MDKLLKIKKECSERITKNKLMSHKYSIIRIILFVILLVGIGIYLEKSNIFSSIMIILSIILFIIACIFHNKIKNKIKEDEKYIEIIKKYENRCNDSWKDEIDNEVTDINFINDLNIIGGNSLLKYIDFTCSRGGKNRLIASLEKNNYEKDEIIKNQESIDELSKDEEFILNFQETMSNIENIKEIDYKKLFNLFNNKTEYNIIPLIISCLLSLITIIIGILSITHVLNGGVFVILFFLQLMISYLYMNIHGEEFESISKCARTYGGLFNTYSFIEKENFKSEKNKILQENIINGKNVVNDIITLANLDTFRLNFITYMIFNVFFSLNFIIIYKYHKFLKMNIQSLEKSVDSLEELEKSICYTTIAIVKKNTCTPTIIDTINIDVKDMKHPLLNEEKCVSNNFKCDKDINIITGSNMSGKTTFMKTIAVNLILAYNGSKINATSFTCPIAKIFTSINVKDDITNGISTFYAELKRIKDILDYSEKSNNLMIVFIDEIFKGTNYNDRILGAKETVKKLSKLNCIVFLTTHDFELCKIEDKEINNYHFSETYENDKIRFDYEIKDGQCKTTNAKYLMKEMNII